jgi:hypothetical protein
VARLSQRGESMTDTENSAITVDSHPRGLKPFVRGQSGNPGGRPRGFGSLIREETRDGAELVEFMLDVARGTRRAKLETRMSAVSWLADRGFGRPIQTTELTGKDGQDFTIRIDTMRHGGDT